MHMNTEKINICRSDSSIGINVSESRHAVEGCRAIHMFLCTDVNVCVRVRNLYANLWFYFKSTLHIPSASLTTRRRRKLT